MEAAKTGRRITVIFLTDLTSIRSQFIVENWQIFIFRLTPQTKPGKLQHKSILV